MTSYPRLGSAFNLFLDRLQQIVRDIAGNASTVLSSSSELSRTAEDLAQGVEDLAVQVRSRQQRSRDPDIQHGRRHVDHAGDFNEREGSCRSGRRNDSQLQGGCHQCGRALCMAADAAELAQRSNESIGYLTAAASEIDQVVEVIQDIAELENLLALNATIEAARAGDALDAASPSWQAK